MKTALFLSTLLVGAQSFAPIAQTRPGSQLNGRIPEDQMDADKRVIVQYQEKWSEIRHMDKEEAQKTLEGEWLEAYNRFHEKYDEDMVKMQEIVDKLQKLIEPPKIQKKSKGQKKRDAYARKLEREGTTA